MKKVLAVFLAVLMLAGMSVNVWAADATLNLVTPSANTDVNGKFNKTVVYSVDITWGNMTFTYSGGDWNPATHEYGTGNWSVTNVGDNVVTVTNNSNAAVNVAIDYNYKDGFSSITGTLTNYRFELASADNTPLGGVLTGTSELTISGNLINDILSGTTGTTAIGTLTITISTPPTNP